jgi:hypothetical protein
MVTAMITGSPDSLNRPKGYTPSQKIGGPVRREVANFARVASIDLPSSARRRPRRASSRRRNQAQLVTSGGWNKNSALVNEPLEASPSQRFAMQPLVRVARHRHRRFGRLATRTTGYDVVPVLSGDANCRDCKSIWALRRLVSVAGFGGRPV